MRITVL